MIDIDKNKFKPLVEHKKDIEQTRPSLTYWADAWRRLKANKLAMLGLVGVIFILIFGIFGPLFTPFSYSDQKVEYKNIPGSLKVYDGDNITIYVTTDYRVIEVDRNGYLGRPYLEQVIKSSNEDSQKINLNLTPAQRKAKRINSKERFIKKYILENKNGSKDEILIDFSGFSEKNNAQKLEIIHNGKNIEARSRNITNKLYFIGTDALGRDLLTRVMYGARISLFIGFLAAVFSFLIGVVYGAVSGYANPKVDNIMMRFVDIINSIPLVLYAILLMVVLPSSGGGLISIMIAICSVFWVSIARLVRGQILSIKKQEFVLAARSLGVSKLNIIVRHLIPNAMGVIIVSLTMMIPTAIFTEAFLSFIGIGVSAPLASWGTLANNALSSFLTFPYQLFYPAAAITFTMLAFNFLGDGLRDALDPKLRKE